MSFAKVYPLYLAKVERKGRNKAELDEIIEWLTGYNNSDIERSIKMHVKFQDFFIEAPALNPSRDLIRGKICGVRVEEIADPLEREVRYLDKLVDELAKGKDLNKIKRQ
ncbi:DUF2200 domain-containing protein [Facklamia sp. DSM 111018]|uniref:DUF2200 domain-containing protein n=1 Tax=Facklamia lactis TaxID=2749967 RepID=A0ABS0LR52_9LACT|nr:DUF2200 domain-containing protein [Facklamia lactis]MBG9980991.1 DUF2200 domain-containing protein [Facklamia lactis]MBG9986646.1 DUF2200 domain-containing protein [Facklamia lactis]